MSTYRSIAADSGLSRGRSRLYGAIALACSAISGFLAAEYIRSASVALFLAILIAFACAVSGIIAARRSARFATAWLGVLESSESGTWELELDTGRLRTSEAWNVLLGYDADSAPRRLTELIALADPRDQAAMSEFLRDFAGDAPRLAAEFRMRRGDGKLLWVRAIAAVVDFDRSGTPTRIAGVSVDIDERRRAAQLQADTARILRATLSSLPSHVAVLSADGTVVLANEAWNLFQGRASGLGERSAEGQNYRAHLQSIRGPEEVQARAVLDAIDNSLAGVATRNVIEYSLDIGAVPQIFAVRVIRFELPDGPRITLTHRDVTTIRTAERTLRESEERWKFAIEGSGAGVWDWYPHDRKTLRSEQFFKMLGFFAHDFGPDFDYVSTLVHPDDRQIVKDKYARLVKGSHDICAFEHRLRHADGSWRWVLARSTVITRNSNGSASRILGVHTDITILKEVEEQLRKREKENRMLALVAQHTTSSVLISNAAGRIEWANQGFEQMTGYALAEVRGKSPGSFLQGPQSDTSVIEFMRTKIRAGEPLRTKIVNYRKDRIPITVAIEIQPVTNVQGQIQHFVGIMEDISERERLEGERRISQKLETVGQLASGIAHEINTPIQFASDSITFVEEAWHELKPLLTVAKEGLEARALLSPAGDAPELTPANVDFLLENFPRAIARAHDGLNRVTGIIVAMKEFAHPDRGAYSGADVNQAIRNTITVARNEFKYVGQVFFDAGDLPLCHCRISAINQVVLNLIVNAAHALADANHSPETGRIDITSRLDADTVVITVADNGGGIPEEIRERIFDPFFTTKEVGRGTGQGLAISRTIVVEQHGGQILVNSKVGSGTAFEIRIPKDARAPVAGSEMPARVVNT